MLSINLNLIQNYKTSKNAFMIYAYVIHTCLNVALMEEDLYPFVISKKHPSTSAAYSQPLVEAYHPHMYKNILLTIESKKMQTLM